MEEQGMVEAHERAKMLFPIQKSSEYIVRAYDVFNNFHEWKVEGPNKAREFAKRIIMEGEWYIDEEDNSEVFLPVHQVIKVKIFKA